MGSSLAPVSFLLLALRRFHESNTIYY